MGYVVRGPTVDGGTRYKPGNPLWGRTGFFIGSKWQHCWAGLREEKEQMLVFKKHKTRKITLIILLFLSSVCNATDNYYVATDGSDSYTKAQAQNPATPWRTLTHALNTITSTDYIVNLAAGTYVEWGYTIDASKNGKTIVIQGASSDANATVFSTGSVSAFIISNCTTGNITWKDMTIKSTYPGNRSLILMVANYDGVQISFNNCILGVSGDTTPGWTKCIAFDPITASPPTRKITLFNSYCYGKDAQPVLPLYDVGTLDINNSLIDRTNAEFSTTTTSAITLGYDIGTVTINNSSIIKSQGYGLNTALLSSFAGCEVDNVTFDCNNEAICITDYLQDGTFTTITANNGIYLGHVYENCSHPLGQIIVQDCNLVHTSSDINAGTFGLVLGYGVTGAEASNNNVLDFGIALSLKGTACNIHHNIFSGGSNKAGDYHTVYVRSAKNCLFENNTVYALGRCALYLYDQAGFPPDPDTDYNTFVNNIFDASGGGTYAIYLRGPEIYHNLFDYNCYVAGSKALGYAGETNKTLDGLRVWWSAFGGSEESRANESHSINTDPQFMDATNGDFHLKSRAGRWDPNSQSWVTDANTSPCIDAGDPNSDWTLELWPHGKRINMGAYGGTPEASMSLSNVGNIADLDNDDCVDYNDMGLFVEKWLYQQVLLPEDLDRNGAVNFIDFAEFSKHWLEDTIL